MAKKAVGSAEGHAAAWHCQSLNSLDTRRRGDKLTWGMGRVLCVLAVRAVVVMRERRRLVLVQAWDVEAIWGRRRMVHLARATLRVWCRVRRRMLHLRRGELEGHAVVLRVVVGHGGRIQK
jgi:hypothetical protein